MSDVAKARRVIMERQLPVCVDDVVAVEIDDTPGSLARILGPFQESRVNVEYMYALAGASSGKAATFFGSATTTRRSKSCGRARSGYSDAEAFGMFEK